MINLLPPKQKMAYKYASSNSTLRIWMVVIIVATIGIYAIGILGVNILKKSNEEYIHKITVSEATYKQQNLEQTQKQVQEISSNLKLAAKVLGQEMQISTILKQISASIPDKAKLSGLTINKSQGAIDITATAPDYNTATQLQVNLSDKNNKVFSKADIVNITCNNAAKDKSLPCTVTVRAQFVNKGKQS